MKKISVEENKKIQVEILDVLDAFCEEHGLTYYLAYGTLIGAIRHKGFIPWDDDIDLLMPIDDYNKLIETFNKEKPVDYIVASCPYDKTSSYPIVKLEDSRTIKEEKGIRQHYGHQMGIGIDIFPLDGVPDDIDEFNDWFVKLHKIYSMYNYNNMNFEGSWKRKVFLPIMRVISRSRKYYLDKAKKLHEKYSFDEGDYIGDFSTTTKTPGNRYKREWFSETIKVEFEGKYYNAPIGYDAYLREKYGDYMEIPPEWARHFHYFNAYWKD